jgi:hypothetical protein
MDAVASNRPPRRSGPPSKPTVPPPFDPVEYARESEMKIRVASRVAAPAFPAAADDADAVIEVDEDESVPPAMSAVPLAVVAVEDLGAVDARTRTIFSAIDGTSTLEEILHARREPLGRGFTLFKQWAAEGRVVFRKR